MSTEVDEIRERLELHAIESAAQFAAAELAQVGFVVVSFSPGDASSYLMMIAEHGTGPDRYLLASNYGPAYRIPGHWRPDPGYCEAKYLTERYANLHTGVVYAEFIAALGRYLQEATG